VFIFFSQPSQYWNRAISGSVINEDMLIVVGFLLFHNAKDTPVQYFNVLSFIEAWGNNTD
jgi:hypothetical protein